MPHLSKKMIKKIQSNIYDYTMTKNITSGFTDVNSIKQYVLTASSVQTALYNSTTYTAITRVKRSLNKTYNKALEVQY